MPNHNDQSRQATEVQLAVIEERLAALQERFEEERSTQSQRYNELAGRLEQLGTKITQLHTDLHGARVGGRVAIGAVALIGTLVGWLGFPALWRALKALG